MSDEQRFAAMKRLLREIKFDPPKRGADETFVTVDGEQMTLEEWFRRNPRHLNLPKAWDRTHPIVLPAQNQEDRDGR